jgi:hypothetical protein
MGFIYCAVRDHNTLQQHATATYGAIDKANCSLRSASPTQLTAFRQVLDCPHLLKVVRRLPIAEVYQNETALAGQALDKHQGRKPPSGRAQNAARSLHAQAAVPQLRPRVATHIVNAEPTPLPTLPSSGLSPASRVTRLMSNQCNSIWRPILIGKLPTRGLRVGG